MRTKNKVNFLLLYMLAALGIPLFAQAERLDALQAYQTGRDMENRNRLAEAEAYYNEAVRICSEDIAQKRATGDTYTVLTWALQRQKKYRQVVNWAQEGLKLYPSDLRLVEILGEAQFYLDNYDASLKSMERYVNGLPRGERTPTAYFYIGEIYRLQGKFLRADLAYSMALKLEPNVFLWWYRLGRSRESAGDYAPAAQAYERALSLNPGNQDAGDALNRVKTRLNG